MSQTTVMSFLPPGVADGRLHGFEFTFEAIPDKSSLHDSHIEVDVRFDLDPLFYLLKTRSNYLSFVRCH